MKKNTEQRQAEINMLKQLLNEKCIKNKKSIDNSDGRDKNEDNRKGVYKMNKSEKKVVSFTHTDSTHIIHIPVKWVRELDVEKDTQIVLEYDGKKITIIKL